MCKGLSKKLFFSIALSIALFLPFKTLSYDELTTHPALTDEIVDLFNLSYKDMSLTTEEKGWVIKGVTEEDIMPRWINHFYDPTTGKGWTAEEMGRLSSSTAMALNKTLLSNQPPVNAKAWAENSSIQSKYKLFDGNRTWQRAIYELAKNNNKKEAYLTLGHILHLIEDMTVPDHTRNDTHAHPLEGITSDYGSPYEEFTKQYYRINGGTNILGNAELLFSQNFKPVIRNKLSDYFEELSIYSNNHFFSKDTINKYSLPVIIKNDELYGYGSDSAGIFPLAYLKPVWDPEQFRVINNYILPSNNKDVEGDSKVLNAYFSRLSKEAIINGAGVIKLFFDEVDKVKSGEKIVEEPPKEISGITSVLAVVKQVQNVYSASASFVSLIASSLSGFLSIQIVSNNKVSSQSNPELTNQPAKDSTSAPVYPPTTITIAQTPKPAVPAQTPVKPPVIIINSVQATTQQIVEAPAQQVVQIITPRQAPAPILAFGYSGGGGSNASTPNILITMPEVDITPPPAAVLDASFADIILTTSTSAQIFGTNSADTAKLLVFSSTSASVSESALVSSTNFSYLANLNPGHNYFYFTALDSNNNTSSLSLQAHIILDNTPPSVPILNIQNQTNVSSTNILINMQSADELSPPVYFDLDFSTNTIDWLSLAASTVNADFNLSGIRGQKYYFRARAADSVGNVSDWSSASSSTFVNWSGEVIINEVAWAGTSADYSSNEWFELYNNTDRDINLNGWKLLVSGKPINWSKVSTTTILARAYYLFERTSDNIIKEISADAIYTLSGGFNNSGEKLELLKPSGEKADEVDTSTGRWFAGDNIKYRSMERIDPAKNGSDTNNWQSNQGFRETGRTYNGGPIYGSPKRSNFGFINLNWNQDDDVRVLTKANNPYILQYYSIPAGKILNIEPGVIIKSYYVTSKIDIYGALNAVGSDDKKIIFTSGRDTSFGSEKEKTIIGSWSTTTPSVKDWQGFWFHPGSTGALDNINFRYAGYGFIVPQQGSLPVYQAIRAENSILTISNSSFFDSSPFNVNAHSYSLVSKNSTTTISNSSFESGDLAVQSENSLLSISSSSFTNFQNIYGPLYIRDRWPIFENLTFTDNTVNMPYLESVTITEPQVSIAQSENYLVLNLKVSTSSTLNIESGASVYVSRYGTVDVYGSLNALGTSENPINFLPISSSSSWGSLRFYNSISALNFVNMKQGNRESYFWLNNNGMLMVNNSNLIINNSSLWMGSWMGNVLQVSNSILRIKDSEIGAKTKVNSSYGINIQGGVLSLDNASFNNLYVGIQAITPASTTLEKKNISAANFISVDMPFFPPTWWNSVSST